jgi:hypothetical protein
LPASLRSDGVRDHPGMPFGFPSEQAFSFAGIPKRRHTPDSVHANGQRFSTDSAQIINLADPPQAALFCKILVEARL